MTAMEDENYFTEPPTLDGVVISQTEILLDRADCLAVSYHADAEAFRGPGAETERIEVFWPRPTDGKWRASLSR